MKVMSQKKLYKAISNFYYTHKYKYPTGVMDYFSAYSFRNMDYRMFFNWSLPFVVESVSV